MTPRRQGAAHQPRVDPGRKGPAAPVATAEVPVSGIYEVLAEAGRADDARRERFYGPLFVEMSKPGAFPKPDDFFSFAGRQWERLKVELGDSHLYADEKRFLLGLLCAAGVLGINLKPMEALAAFGQGFVDGRRGRRLDLLNRELEAMRTENPDLTEKDVFFAFDVSDPPDFVIGVDEGTVDWHDSSGKVRKTSRDGIKKRLQRLRRTGASH